MIARDAAQPVQVVTCPHCGTPVYYGQLLGRANREDPPATNEMNGTWEGAA